MSAVDSKVNQASLIYPQVFTNTAIIHTKAMALYILLDYRVTIRNLNVLFIFWKIIHNLWHYAEIYWRISKKD